jgi:thioredoxin-dependent peroxiredoxin
MRAPDFSLPDQYGDIHTLSDYKDKWLLIYFYPKDETPGCTKEACNFRDNSEAFAEKGVEIIGISKDSVSSHIAFSQKHELPFPILSDETAETIKAFGAWGEKKFIGKTYEGINRNTYLINPEGEILHVYENVNPLTHVSSLLKDIDTFIEEY